MSADAPILSPNDVAYLQNRGSTNTGVRWDAPIPGQFGSVPYNQSYGGVPGPQATGYNDLSSQILDALRTPGRYQQSWLWNNGAGRYKFGAGQPPTGNGLLPSGGSGGMLGGGFSPGSVPNNAGGLPPPSAPPPAATGGTGGFGPVPPGTPPTPSGQPVPGQANAVAQWSSLQSPDARSAYLLGMPASVHNALLAAGLISGGDVNAASNQWGGYAGVDRATGRPWVSYDGNTRTFLS